MRSLRTGLAAFVAFLIEILAACSDPTTSVMQPPPPPPVSVQVAYCPGLEPAWVAFQDGDGAWTRAMPTTANGRVTFAANLTSDRAGIATVTLSSGGLTSLHVLLGAPDELGIVGDTSPRFCGPPISKSLVGSVAGLDTNEFAIIRAGSEAQALGFPNIAFELHVVPPGPQDILATQVSPRGATDTIPKFILRRGVDLPDGATLPVLDFGSAEAFAPAVANISLTGSGDGASISTRLVTSGFNSTYGVVTGQDLGTVRPYFAIPEAQLLPGDLQVLHASGHGATPNSARSAARVFRAVQDYTIALGPDVVAPTFATVATTPTLRLAAQFVNQTEYGRLTSVTFQEDGTNTRLVIVSMTQDYALHSGGGYDLVVPELTGVAGFQPAWALSPTNSLRWAASRVGGTFGLGIDPVLFDGATQRGAFISDVLTP